METLDKGRQRHAMRAGWPPHRTLWFWLLLGWTVSAADRALTGPGGDVDDRQPRRLPGRHRQALRAGRPHRRPVLRRLHAHPVARRLPRRPLRAPDDDRRQPRVGGHRDAAQRRHHRPRALHRHPRAHRPRRGRVLLQRPQPDRREDAGREAQPRHGRGHHRPGLRHHDRHRLRAEHDRAGRQGLRRRPGVADAVPHPRHRDADRRRSGSPSTSAARSAGCPTRARRCTSAPTPPAASPPSWPSTSSATRPGCRTSRSPSSRSRWPWRSSSASSRARAASSGPCCARAT